MYNTNYNRANTFRGYNNVAAHNTLKAIMNRRERIRLYFTILDGCEAIKLESETTRAFFYQINEASFGWIMNYLMQGETEDVAVNPAKKLRSMDTPVEYRKYMMMLFMENKVAKIQVTPEFRDKPGKMSASASFRNGVILFFMNRDEEITGYLREKGMIR